MQLLLISVLAWSLAIILIACGVILSRELTKKLPNTRNNLNPNRPTFPSRLKLYFFRHLIGYLFAASFPGIVLFFVILRPDIFLARDAPLLMDQFGNAISDPFVFAFFIADQALKGVAYDIMEVYDVTITSARLAPDTPVFRAMLVAYRLVVSSFGLFMLLTVLDYVALKVNLPLGKDKNGKDKRLNLSGLARKGIISWEPPNKGHRYHD